MGTGGTALCLSIGPSTALLYYLLGLLSRVSVPAVAGAARSLLKRDAGGLTARRQVVAEALAPS